MLKGSQSRLRREEARNLVEREDGMLTIFCDGKTQNGVRDMVVEEKEAHWA
jgi:hypothetical protein